METLIALMLLSKSPQIVSHYKVGHCYATDSEFRPNIIKIELVGKKEYLYSLWIKPTNYSGYYTLDLSNSIDVIENVYTDEVKCP